MKKRLLGAHTLSYWKVARQWNTGHIVDKQYSVSDANKVLNKVITSTHTTQRLAAATEGLQNQIIRNSASIEPPTVSSIVDWLEGDAA